MSEKSQNTNLASEYYVLSMLYRIGANAYLTLGNKKSVDIIVDKNNQLLSIDVKGLKGTTGFPVDNWVKKEKTHFLVFVSFLNKIDDPQIVPETYIVPSLDIDKSFRELDGKSLVYLTPSGTRKDVLLSNLRKLKNNYLHKWDFFI